MPCGEAGSGGIRHEAPAPIDENAQPAAAGLTRQAAAAVVSKKYAVGLEMSCPDGAYSWAPEIPSAAKLTCAMLSKCELVHKSCHDRPQVPFRPLRARSPPAAAR
jgi:hypothetical protein